MQRGRLSCESFLKYYAATNNLPRRQTTIPTQLSDTPGTALTTNNGDAGGTDGVAAGAGDDEVVVVVEQAAVKPEGLPSVAEGGEREGNQSVEEEALEMTTTDETSPCE